MEGVSLKNSVLSAGWCLVDSCLSLNRKEVTSTELVFIGNLMETTNYACLLQKAYKQLLLNTPLTILKEIKPHTSGLIHVNYCNFHSFNVFYVNIMSFTLFILFATLNLLFHL